MYASGANGTGGKGWHGWMMNGAMVAEDGGGSLGLAIEGQRSWGRLTVMVVGDWFDDETTTWLLYSREKMAWQHEHGLLDLVGVSGDLAKGDRLWGSSDKRKAEVVVIFGEFCGQEVGRLDGG